MQPMGVVMRSEDIKEGLTAFIEKRPRTGRAADAQSHLNVTIRRATMPARS